MSRTTTCLAALLAVVATAMPATTASGSEPTDPPPALGGQLYSTGAPVTIEVMNASAGLTSTLFLLEPEEVRIATNRDVGTSVTVGPYANAEELVFGIRVSGQEYRLGPGTRNPDGLAHAIVDFGLDGCAVVGFEDLFGGGDRDYDDNRFRFCGGIAPDPQDPPEDPPTPDPVQPPRADAGPDQDVPEGSVVSLDASASQASTKPALGESHKQGILPGGTSMGVRIAGLDPDTDGLRLKGGVDLGQGPPAQNTSIAYVLDVSGSTGGGGACGGDANGDHSNNTILDCEIAAALKLHEEVAASGTVDKVAVIRFSSSASALDLNPTSATATMVSPTADADADGILDVEEALRTLRIGGGTFFLPPTSMACSMLATTGSPNLVTAFLSDGQGSGRFSSVVPCDPPVEFQAFAVGGGSSCNGGGAGSRLADLALLTNGACTNVPDVSNLPDILPSVIASRITKVEYAVDGGDPVDISAQLGLPSPGPADLDLAVDLPDGLAGGTHEICVTVTGEDAGGSSSETTCSELVTVTGELSYSWGLVSSEGPPVFLSSRASAHPTFVVPDDGRYVFELTVSDGSGSTATDRVVVVVDNVDPHLTIVPGDSYVGGVTQINGTLTDLGWQDTHRAVVDWGDGTTDEVDVTTYGAGWGTFFASHVFKRAGNYDVRVTLSDDDNGSDTAGLEQFEVGTPVAVWANSTSSTSSLDWSGGSGHITGRVHTNGELRFVGAAKSVQGPTTYAGPLSADTSKNSFVPLPEKSGVQDFPFHPDIAAFRPGGPIAEEIGTQYHDMSSACASGSWHEVEQTLTSGVYYADCDIMLNGSDIGGRVTLVTERRVKISGSKPAFEPFYDGLLLVAGAVGDQAIEISTSKSKFLGVLFAGSGQIRIPGASNRFFCGILGDQVDISGTDVSVRGASCGRPDSTVAGPVLVPDLAADIEVDKPDALPSDALNYDIRITNHGSTLVVPSLIGLENVDTRNATVNGYSFSIERLDAVSGTWVPLASSGDPELRVNLRSNPFAGVTYPAQGGVPGTVIAPGGWATWGLQAVLDLAPAVVESLLDPARTSALRTRVDFDLAPVGVQARRLYTYGNDFIEAMRALSGDASDAHVTAIMPDGDALRLLPEDSPELASIAPGETVSLTRSWQVPVPAERGTGETDAGYLARLLALDGTRLNAAAFAVADGGVGRLVAPLAQTASTRSVPVVGVSTTGPAEVPAGTSADYAIRLANLGSAEASSLQTEASADGTALTVTGAPTALTPREIGEGVTTYAAPTGASGPAPVRGTAQWTDARGNAYGPTGSSLDVVRLAPAQLRATLTDALQTDVGGDGAVSPGDVVRYTLTVRNGGGVALSGVSGTVDIDPNATLVPGSARTPDGGSAAFEAGDVAVTLPDIDGDASRTVTFDVAVRDPFPDGSSRVTAQGTIAATGLPNQATDDPALPGSTDPTRTTVSQPRPALTAALGGRLVVDADGSGVVSPGDTLAYTLSVSSVGTQEVTGIGVSVPAPTGTTLVEGSVSTSQGMVNAGPDVDVAVGTLAPFQEAVVTFRLRVDDPLAAGVSSVAASGVVTSDQLAPMATDDPVTQEIGDANTIPIGDPATNPEKPGPVAAGVAPAEGAVVTEPLHVVATLTPPEGATLSGWSVYYRQAGDATTTEIGSGSGADVDAILDPTKMPNGAYIVTVRGTSSNGGVSAEEITVVIDGQAKLGRYQTTITDMTVGVAGLPIQVNRTYDSFDKAQGDFGIGWNVSLANFRVSTNGPLGAGGWTMQGCGTGLIFVPLCFTSSQPHFVTVTWPDGRNEVFDLRPVQGSTFFPGLTTAAFKGRQGSTSTLSAPHNGLYFSNGNLGGGFFGSDGVYDPHDFVLTDKSGTKYHVTVGVGLTKVVDLAGDTTTFGPNGVTSSRGTGIVFDRDPQGRIKKITDPEGAAVEYGYDAAGDLVSVKDQRGNTASLTYFPGHYLKSVDDPSGRPMATYEYTDGRIAAVIDGEGNRTVISSDPGSRQETVTDPGGRRTTISTYDDAGHLKTVNEVYGGADHVTEYGYDVNDNLIYRKDPSGHEWRAVYVDGSITSFTDPAGDTTEVTYNDLAQPLTWEDPAGSVTTYVWNPNGTLGSVRDALGHVESYSYFANGLRKSRTDRNGKVWNWTYTPEGLLESETDPLGGVTRYEYDDAGRLEATVDAEGNRSTTTHDAAGNRRTQTDADGKVHEWVYDELNRVKQTIDPTGAAVVFTYDAAGRLKTQDNHVDASTVYSYDPMGRQTSVKVGSLPASTTTYDGAGNVATRTDEIGRTTSYTYYPDGRLHTETNPAGGVTTYTYTADGQVATRTDPGGDVTKYTYRATGRPATVVDAAGVSTETRYDAVGRPRFTIFADGTQTEQRYDPVGNLVASVDQQGDTTTYEYDDAGRRVATVDPEGRRTETGYDSANRVLRATGPDGGDATSSWSPGGRLLTSTTPEGVTTSFGYDDAGRQASITDELGHVWSTRFDDLGRVVEERDPRQQGAGPATVTNEYDGHGRLSSTRDALGNTVVFGYDDAGQRTSVKDPRGKVWSVTYDALGHVVEERDPLGRVRSADYDAAGRLENRTDARGVVADYSYGSGHRLEGLSERGGTGSIEYTYDELGRRATMTDATGTTTWDYFPDGAVQKVTAPADAVTYSYDRSGLRTSMTQPKGTLTYGYDAAGRLASTEDWNGRTTTAVFDSDGRVESLVRPNGIKTEWAYDVAGRMTGLEHLDGATVVDRAAYTLDADGNRTALRTSAGTETYTLNPIDQLVNVTYPNGAATEFTYDAAGNRRTATTNGSPTVEYAYDDASQLASVAHVAVQHDANGNLTGGADGTTYGWDWLSRMTSVEAGGQQTRYGYDGDGVRTSDTVGGSTTKMVYDRYSARGVADLIEAGTASYVHGPGGVLERVEGAATSWPLADGVGSVRTVTDGAGAVAGRSSYDVFGGVRSSSGTDVGLGFTGAPQSGDLVHLSARDLSTSLGRFLSTDPVSPGAPGVVGWNPYSYVANNPTTWTDPSGASVAMEYGNLIRVTAVALVGAFALQQVLINSCLYDGTCTPTLDPPWGNNGSNGGNNNGGSGNVGQIADRYLQGSSRAGELSRAAAEAMAKACLASNIAALFPGISSPCDADVALFFVGMDTPETLDHTVDALLINPRWTLLHRQIPPHSRAWTRSDSRCAGRSRTMWCDEYPFASAEEGGGPWVSLRLIPAAEQRVQGGRLSALYADPDCNLASSGRPFAVIPVPTPTTLTGHYCG